MTNRKTDTAAARATLKNAQIVSKTAMLIPPANMEPERREAKTQTNSSFSGSPTRRKKKIPNETKKSVSCFNFIPAERTVCSCVRIVQCGRGTDHSGSKPES